MCDQPQARQRYRSAKRRSLTGYSSPSYSAMNTTSSMLRGNVSPEVGERGRAAVYVTVRVCLIICLVSIVLFCYWHASVAHSYVHSPTCHI